MSKVRRLQLTIPVADFVHIPLAIAALNSMCLNVDDIDVQLNVASHPVPPVATQQQLDDFGARVKDMTNKVQAFDQSLNAPNAPSTITPK